MDGCPRARPARASCQERQELKIVISLPHPAFAGSRLWFRQHGEVPMDAIFTLVTAVTVFGVATAAVLYVTGRAWRRRHTYVEDFWQRGGW